MTGIMAHYIGRAVVTAHLEIPMLGRKPAVKDFDHLDWSLAEPETPGLLLATVARIALHFDDEITHEVLLRFGQGHSLTRCRESRLVVNLDAPPANLFGANVPVPQARG